MKKTKTIEVNVCDQCGAEVGDWHIKDFVNPHESIIEP